MVLYSMTDKFIEISPQLLLEALSCTVITITHLHCLRGMLLAVYRDLNKFASKNK